MLEGERADQAADLCAGGEGEAGRVGQRVPSWS